MENNNNLQNLLDLIVARYKEAFNSLEDSEDRAALERLGVNLIECIFGEDDIEDVPDIIKTMKEIFEDSNYTDEMLKVVQEFQQNNYVMTEEEVKALFSENAQKNKPKIKPKLLPSRK